MAHSVSDMQLALFFTRGYSLRQWDDMGLFEREVALYRALRPHLAGVTFATYGDVRDRGYAERLKQIRILCNHRNLPERRYQRLLTWIYPLLWRQSTIVKSNQMLGADVALTVARRHHKKFIARCGYLLSNRNNWMYGADSPEAKYAHQLEAKVFHGADQVVVTTPEIKQTVQERHGVAPTKVRVIPNYVDTHLFHPIAEPRQPHRICCLSRMEEKKNLHGLFDALRGLDVQLDLIGGGQLKEELVARVRKEQLPVNFIGTVPHGELPRYFNRAALFILPSLLEGHPKALIEAMACGTPVIGAASPGIRELIRHGETGYLCGPSAHELRTALQDMLGDADQRARMGHNARAFVVEHFSLERIVKLELALFAELLADNTVPTIYTEGVVSDGS